LAGLDAAEQMATMIILGIDTSGRDGSIALARGSGERFEAIGVAQIAGGTYSAQLIPARAALLAGASLAKSAIDLLAVASGPGSFTGLRVGLSTVKGLAEALGKPIVAVSMLEATAAASRQTASVVAALDAQRGDVYVGEYQLIHSEVPSELRLHRIDEVLLSLENFTASLGARIPVPVTYTPDATVERAVRESGSAVERIPRPGADLIARLGVAKYLQGLTTSSEALDANYLRHSDAEIFATPKSARPPE
jgi:tRNA threonylcarbamoyladenosine biosynthesis protein TsaB